MKCIVCYLQLWKHFPSYCWAKKNIQKRKRVITFSDYLLCESASSAAHGVTVCLIFDQFYTISDYVLHMSFLFRLLDIWRISAEFSPSMRSACLSRPSVLWPFTNHSLKVAFILIRGMSGRSISHFLGRQCKESAQTSFIPEWPPLTSSVWSDATWKTPNASEEL